MVQQLSKSAEWRVLKDALSQTFAFQSRFTPTTLAFGVSATMLAIAETIVDIVPNDFINILFARIFTQQNKMPKTIAFKSKSH